MKKNLFLGAILLAFVSMFSSCGTDLETTVKITLDPITGTTATGKIEASGGLKSVSLLLNATTVGSPITSFSTGSSVIGTATDGYTFRFENLAAGSYSLKAVDKKDVESTVTFTVTAATTLTALSTSTTIKCTTAGVGNTSTCASADGTTYDPATATLADQAKVDFVFVNGNGTSAYGPLGSIYAPSSTPSGLALIEIWGTKNTTYLEKSTIVYADATYATVKSVADAVTKTSVTTLAANDVVVFKTTKGKVGIFKVLSIDNSTTASGNIVINIKVQN